MATSLTELRPNSAEVPLPSVTHTRRVDREQLLKVDPRVPSWLRARTGWRLGALSLVLAGTGLAVGFAEGDIREGVGFVLVIAGIAAGIHSGTFTDRIMRPIRKQKKREAKAERVARAKARLSARPDDDRP